MKRLFQVVSVFVVLGLLLVPAHSAENGLPFLPEDENRTIEETIQAYLDMPLTSVVGAHFWKETKKNTGMTREMAKFALQNGLITTQACGRLTLLSAGLTPDKKGVRYQRVVKPSELVAYVTLNGQCIPWFLPKCGNPVMSVVRFREQPIRKEKKETVERLCERCGCFPIGPPEYEREYDDSYIYHFGGGISIEEHGDSDSEVFIPVRCF